MGIVDEEVSFEADEEIQLDDHDLGKSKNDPYIELGFGICAYFNMIKAFIFTFIILSLLALPMMYLYEYHEGLKGNSHYNRIKFSLGNMGFSESVCDMWYIGITSPITFS